jgi:hypothetical protein
MIDRVDADKRIEGAVLERERLARVCLHETRTRLKARIVREPGRLRDRLLGELDAHHLATGPPCEVKGRTTRTAANIQKALAGSKVEPGEKAVELIKREPAVLADVLTERRAPDLLVDTRGESPVMRPVVIDNLGPLSHTPSLRRGREPDRGADTARSLED